MPKQLLITLLSLTLSAIVSGQVTDNAGKDLFTVKNTSNFSFPITSTGFSVNYTRPFATDSIPILADEYTRLLKEGNPDIAKRGANQFFRLKRHNNRLQTYYLKDTMNFQLDTLLRLHPDLLDKSLNILGASLSFNGLVRPTATDSSTQLVKIFNQSDTFNYHELLDTLSSYGLTDGFYNSTDAGIWWKPAFYNFKVSNLSFGSLSDFFTPNNQPTLQAELGFIYNTTLKFDNWKNLQKAQHPGFFGHLLRFHQYDFFYSFFVNTNCITYYDTVRHQRYPTDWKTCTQFAQWGLKANANLYYSKSFAIALTGTLFRGLPLDADKGFQSKPSRPISTTDSTHYAAGKAEGKYGGDITSQSWNTRLSVAFPIFLNFFHDNSADPKKKGSGSVYLLPSYAPFGTIGGHWTNQLGFSVNLLGKPYGGVNTSILQAGGVGCDILSDPKKHTGWGGPVFYVTGTININSIISQKGVTVAR